MSIYGGGHSIGDWLKREAERGGIEAQKRDAKMTCLGVKGYRPVVATLKETPVVICYEFKEGNDNGGPGSQCKRCHKGHP